MIKIHFHIGQPKTGSSSIQRMLKNNVEELKKQGYLYAPNGVDHQKIFHELRDRDDFRAFLDEQKEQAEKNGCSNVIISYEDLFFKKRELLNNWFDGVHEEYYAYVYLRRQDLYLESAWKQWHFKDLRYKDFNDYLEKFKVEDYYAHLKKWETYVRKEHMTVVPFEKRNLEDGLLKSFLRMIGIKELTGFDFVIQDDGWGENKGLTEEGLELAFAVRGLARNNIHDHTIQHFINRYFKDFQKEHFANYSLIDADVRDRIIREYAPVNERIAREFLGSSDRLFQDAVPSSSSRSPMMDINRLTTALLTIGIQQDTAINLLKEEVRQLKEQLSSLSSGK